MSMVLDAEDRISIAGDRVAVEQPPLGAIENIADIDGGGAHTLVFVDPKFAGFELKVGPPAKSSGKIEFAPGTYTFYCSIPGHRAAGMQADVVVTAGAGASGATGASGTTGATS